MIEEWKAVGGFPAYEVSSLGRVRRVVSGKKNHKCRVMSPWQNNKGYFMVGLVGQDDRARKLVHRLVCEAFHGPAPTDFHDAAHNDGSRTNNTPENLRWATRSENMQDAIKHGTFVSGSNHWTHKTPDRTSKGERHGMAVLTADEVLKIRSSGAKGVDLADIYGVSPATISMIRNRKIWSHLDRSI